MRTQKPTESLWRKNGPLALGDTLTLAVITVIGFLSHGSALSDINRVLTTFIPLVLSWFLLAPHLGVYEPENWRQVRQLWRPSWAIILATPLAAWMRGLWLGSAIEVSFVAALALSSALAILAWRAVVCFWLARKK